MDDQEIPVGQTAVAGAAKKQADLLKQLEGTVQVVEGKVKAVVDQVENPADREAKATFGYKPTVGEKKRQALLRDLAEKGWWVLALIVVALILVFNWGSLRAFYDFVTMEEQPVVITEVPEPTSVVVSSIFSGKIAQLNRDLGWLNQALFQSIYYYEAGEVISGEYEGAKRYFAATTKKDSGVFRIYELWQLVDGQVLFNGGRPNAQLYLQNLQDYYLGQYFAETVRFQDEFSDNFPQTIAVSSTMLLYRREVLTDLGPYDGALYGEPRLELTMDPGEYQKLSSLEARNYKDLAFYSKIYSPTERASQVTGDLSDAQREIVDRYLWGGSKVIVTDNTGLAMVYELIFLDQWENYRRSNLSSDLRFLDYYRQELVKYVATANFGEYRAKLLAGEQGELPEGVPSIPPVELGTPGFVFMTQIFTFDTKRPGFNGYVAAFSNVCQRIRDGKILTNVTKEELTQIGKVSLPQVPIYRLTDSNHVLYQLAYSLKVALQTLDLADYMMINQEPLISAKGYDRRAADRIRNDRQKLELPNFNEYVAAEPILIVVDPWERLIMVWESDLEFSKDCATIGDSNTVERIKAF